MRWGALGLSGGLLALFATGHASALLPPSYFWWTGLPASFLPFIATAAFGVMAAHALARHWLWVGAYSLLLVLFLFRMGVPYGQDAPPNEETLQILTLNFTPPDDSPPAQTFLRHAWGTFANTYDPDIIAVQSMHTYRRGDEVRLFHQLDTLTALGYEVEPQSASNRLNTYVPVFLRNEGVPRQDVIEMESHRRSGRHITRSEIEWDEQRFALYNVHLHSFDRLPFQRLFVRGHYRAAAREFASMYRRGILQRVQEARELREIVAADSLPVLLVGDLNASPFNWEYRHLRGELQDLAAQSGANWRFTWHAEAPMVRIDHVLGSRHWRAVHTKVDDYVISDHLPLVVGIRFRE